MHKHKAGALDGWLGDDMSGYPRLSFESGLIYVRINYQGAQIRLAIC